MSRICRSRSRRWCAPARRAPQIGDAARRRRLRAPRRSDSRRQTRACCSRCARVVLRGATGHVWPTSLTRLQEPERRAAAGAQAARSTGAPHGLAAPARELEFFNGLGGFAEGRPRICDDPRAGQSTPAPWINVVANPAFRLPGFRRGQRLYLGAQQPREPAHAVVERSRFAIRRAKRSTCATTKRARSVESDRVAVRDDAGAYVARHGRGYSRFEHASHGIALDLLQYRAAGRPDQDFAPDDPQHVRPAAPASVTAYAEWVLGASRTASAPYRRHRDRPETGALFARNPWNGRSRSRVAFADLGGRQTSWTGDRREFLGRNGTLATSRRARRPARRCRAASARASTRAARCRPRSSSSRTKAVEVVFFLGKRRRARRRTRADRALSRRRSRRRALAR